MPPPLPRWADVRMLWSEAEFFGPTASVLDPLKEAQGAEKRLMLGLTTHEQEAMEMINLIKELNCKIGISVKPNTPIENVYKFLPYVHMCLVMTVEPGKGGQTLLTDMVSKIATLKQYVDENNIEIDIEADGGINLRTAESVKQAGTNILVAGTAILSATNYKTIIDELKK